MDYVITLSTCGTSVLTNGATADERRALTDTAGARTVDLTLAEGEVLAARVSSARSALHAPDAVARSAELSALAALLGPSRLHTPAAGRAPDQYVLLATDTAQGEASAELLREWLAVRGHVAHVLRFGGLAARDLASFQLAAGDLARWCERDLAALAADARVVFNVTGGLKSISGFVQALGMLYADEVIALFEGSDELLRIPRLPLRVDATDAVRANLPALRRLAAGLDLPATDARDVPDLFLMRLEDRVALSPWGTVTWERSRADVYGTALLGPWSALVWMTEAFERDARGLAAERLVVLNERLDDLCAFRETGQHPRRLRFHSISANARPPSTHETHVWSDLTDRIYGHFENDVFVLDALGPHL